MAQKGPTTGISILVVGGGIAGLSFAIEAHRKGHNVKMIERRPPGESTGEMIVITASALRTPSRWPGFMPRARRHAASAETTVKKFDGTLIGTFPIGDPQNPSLAIYRSKLHQVLYEYAVEIGVVMEFDAAVEGYFETKEKGVGGIVLSDGHRFTADLVVAADGVGSKSWELVVGRKEAPISSGFVLYRVTFPAAPALENPVIAAELGGESGSRGILHAGPGAHVVSCLSGGEICWLMTCREDSDEAEEDWVKATSTDKALKQVEGWEPYMTELIKATPDNKVLDWKLMWRNPQPQWTSPAGRVVQIGDAAHPFLPTSASGATMAMEDAFSLVMCLQVAGKDDIALATKVHNHLRFVRVSCAQKTGFKNRELYHKTDWDAVARDPKIMGKMVGDWVTRHDPEEYACANYHACAEHLLSGKQKPFVNTNAVPGYEYVPWTVGELLAAQDGGVELRDEGDW